MGKKKTLRNLALAAASTIVLFGISIGTNYISQKLKGKNSAYIKNIEEKAKEKIKFEEEYLDALKKGKIKYTHCGKNIPLWYVDINEDGKFDGYILHVVGSTRGSNGIGLYPIKN